MSFLDQLKYDAQGLVTVIFQDCTNDEVLTLAYANREALSLMLDTEKAYVYRRSHGKVMMKGETSGHQQLVREILVDCDGDALVVRVEQVGPDGSRGAACHEGYRSCFYRRAAADGTLVAIGERVFQPEDVYKSDAHR